MIRALLRSASPGCIPGCVTGRQRVRPASADDESGPATSAATSCSGGRSFMLCLADCDPLAQDCEPDDVCLGDPNGAGFVCALDASGDEGQVHDPCMFANACDPGLLCLDSTAAAECDQEQSGCCQPFCDLTVMSMCPGQGQLCNPYFEEGTAPPGYEDVGYCAVPMP